MKRILLYLTLLTIGLCCSCKDKTVDNDPSLDLFYISNSTSNIITYEIVGATDDQANRLGYTLKGSISPNSNKEIYKSVHVAVAGYGFDSLKISNHNSIVVFKTAVPYPFSEKCKIEKIDETTSKWTLDVNVNLLN